MDATARGSHVATTEPAAGADSKPGPLLQVQEEDVGGDLTPMPELQHNMRLLVDVAEADIRRLDARLRHEQVGNRLCDQGHTICHWIAWLHSLPASTAVTCNICCHAWLPRIIWHSYVDNKPSSCPAPCPRCTCQFAAVLCCKRHSTG